METHSAEVAHDLLLVLAGSVVVILYKSEQAPVVLHQGLLQRALWQALVQLAHEGIWRACSLWTPSMSASSWTWLPC